MLALLCLPFFVYLYRHAQVFAFGHPLGSEYDMARYHVFALVAASFVSAWLLVPLIHLLLETLRARLAPDTKRFATICTVALTCVFVTCFLVYFGRWQFGGFDYNIFLETGWRQALGQRPYIDFQTGAPPFFNLGAALAFRLSHAAWNASLYIAAVFASGTLVWLFMLFRRLGMSASASLGTALTIEAAAMLLCCFWWYNNTTLVLATVFFFSCLLLARAPALRFAQASFVLSLAVLPLTKPNIAGISLLTCLLLLFLHSRNRLRLLLLTLAGSSLSLLLFVVNRVSIPAMLASYQGVAKERGAFSTFGFQELNAGEQHITIAWVICFCIPLLGVLPALFRDLRARRFRSAVFWLFFAVAPLVAAYGIAGNGEFRDVECTLLFGSMGVVCFGLKKGGGLLRRVSIAVLFATLVSDLYLGVVRLRVFTIGVHMFFEWTDNEHRIPSGALKDMRVSQTMVDVQSEVDKARDTDPGPYFFGPRVDYNYAQLRLPSPLHFPAWWHPGTAFPRSETAQILRDWQADCFATLIFLRDDYTYYPPEFLEIIRRDYTEDDALPRITVYHRHRACNAR